MSATAQAERNAADGSVVDAGPPLLESEDFGFLMTNISPRRTGLPMVVWVGPRYGARHDVRVRVCMVPGSVMHSDQLATVAVRPEPRLLHGRLSARDFGLVARWIKLNEAAILEFWDNDEFDGLDFSEAMKPV